MSKTVLKHFCTILIIISLGLMPGCNLKQEIFNQNILNQSITLPRNGILRQKENGYVYLKLDDAYIHGNYQTIQERYRDVEKSPYFRKADAIGAHISVMHEQETKGLKIKELGAQYNFTIKKFKVTENKNIIYYVLELDAPEIECLRSSYGLPRLLNNNKFHITLALRK